MIGEFRMWGRDAADGRETETGGESVSNEAIVCRDDWGLDGDVDCRDGDGAETGGL